MGWRLSESTGTRQYIVVFGRLPNIYRTEAQPSYSVYGTTPTFPEFVLYLLATDVAKYNSHWLPIHLLCRPCSFPYTIVAKTETIERDSRKQSSTFSSKLSIFHFSDSSGGHWGTRRRGLTDLKSWRKSTRHKMGKTKVTLVTTDTEVPTVVVLL